MGYSLGVSHAPHFPGRKEAYARYVASLGREPDVLEDRPAKPWEWPVRLWEWTLVHARTHGNTHVLFGQDDTTVCADFEAHVSALLEARPKDVICFHTPHWLFGALADAGHMLAYSFDGLVGNGYAMPVDELEAHLAFRERDLFPAARCFNEDSQIALGCMARGRNILHPLRAFIDNHADEPSVYGNEGHLYRNAQVPAMAEAPEGFDWSGDVPHMGLVYESAHWGLISHLTPEARRKYKATEKAYLLHAYLNPRVPPALSAATV